MTTKPYCFRLFLQTKWKCSKCKETILCQSKSSYSKVAESKKKERKKKNKVWVYQEYLAAFLNLVLLDNGLSEDDLELEVSWDKDERDESSCYQTELPVVVQGEGDSGEDRRQGLSYCTQPRACSLKTNDRKFYIWHRCLDLGIVVSQMLAVCPYPHSVK